MLDLSRTPTSPRSPLSYLAAQDVEHGDSQRSADSETRVALDPHSRRKPATVPCRAPLLAADGSDPLKGQCDEFVRDCQPPVGGSLSSLVKRVHCGCRIDVTRSRARCVFAEKLLQLRWEWAEPRLDRWHS